MWAAANERSTDHLQKRRFTDVEGVCSPSDRTLSNPHNYSDSWTDTENDSTICDKQSTTETFHDDLKETMENYDRIKNHSRKKRKNKYCEETPEVIIARLTSSYSSAVNAVGALNRASEKFYMEMNAGRTKSDNDMGRKRTKNSKSINTSDTDSTSLVDRDPDRDIDDTLRCNTDENAYNICDDDDDSHKKLREAHFTLRRVALAARNLFENSLLLDPIIFASILSYSKENINNVKTPIHYNDDKHCIIDESGVHALTLNHMSSAWFNVWCKPNTNKNPFICDVVKRISFQTWNRLSSVHRASVKQIAYLCLVNYADLLMSGCTCYTTMEGIGDTLNQGAVKVLKALKFFSSFDSDESTIVQSADALRCSNEIGRSLAEVVPRIQQNHSISQIKNIHSHSECCLWSNECRERTIRLALASLCDASDLDSSDPSLWFKLACAARVLSREVGSTDFIPESILRPPRSYRCLEKIALERGISSLPHGSPPNRMLMRAWREIIWDRRPIGIVSDVDKKSIGISLIDDQKIVNKIYNPIELIIHLPKYSWSTLGRILMQLCREGSSFGRDVPAVAHTGSLNYFLSEEHSFGSPLVEIIIAPILSLSHAAFGIICGFLGEDVKRFSCTNKGLSVKLSSMSVPEDKNNLHVPVLGFKVNENNDMEAENETIYEFTSEVQTKSSRLSSLKGRVSNRIRRHMITSERQAQQSSVEFCLTEGILSCNTQNTAFSKLITAGFKWDNLDVLKLCVQDVDLAKKRSPLSAAFMNGSKKTHSISNHHKSDFLEQSSLSYFIQQVSRNNSGPMDLLKRFLLHVSFYPACVFADDNVDLTSCFIDCFEYMTVGIEGLTEMSSAWFGEEKYDEDLDLVLQNISVNLLYSELLLKRCEPHGFDKPNEFSDDAALLACTVPKLLQFLQRISFSHTTDRFRDHFNELDCRCNWLASAYYSWISRCSMEPSIEASAEKLGIEYLSAAIESLSRDNTDAVPSVQIKTPHLLSPERLGDHWALLSFESLSKYKKELQSSLIVHRARKEFLDIQRCVGDDMFCSETNQYRLTVAVKKKLLSLGNEILRWCTNDKLVELMTDFIMLHQDQFNSSVRTPINESSRTISPWVGPFNWNNLWSTISSSKDTSIAYISSHILSRPSILQVLACSLLASEEQVSSVLILFSQAALTVLRMRSRLFCEDSNHVDTGAVSLDHVTITQNVETDFLSLTLASFFIDKITHLIRSNSISSEIESMEFLGVGNILSGVMYASLSVLHDSYNDQLSQTHIYLFQSLSQLMFALSSSRGLSRSELRQIEAVYFVCLAKAFILQRNNFAQMLTSLNKKEKKLPQVNFKADCISHIAHELANLLSLYPSTVNPDGTLVNSHIVTALIETKVEANVQSVDLAPMAQLAEAMLWFWKFINNDTDTIENSLRSRIQTPISASIISLCGSYGFSLESNLSKVCLTEDETETTNINFSDCFDSEDGLNNCSCDENVNNESKKKLLKKLNQLVQCVTLIFNSVLEKGACQESESFLTLLYQNGPLVPLVVTRTLSNLSDDLFSLFSYSVWCEVYPSGARSCGIAIDSVLISAYPFLYGFTLLSQNQNLSEQLTERIHTPESIKAAAQLFRCIRRLYHNNRRSPPIKALETVEKALPCVQETKISSAIRAFLFNAENEIYSTSIEDLPSGFPAWVLSAPDDEEKSVGLDRDDVKHLRKMLCHELSKRKITRHDSNQKSLSDSDIEELSAEREITQRHELSLYNKFRAVLDDLCYNPMNIEGWVVLSECLGFKADIICDRLIPVKESYNPTDFRPSSKSFIKFHATMSIDEVKESQLKEVVESRKKRVSYLGDNLYVYVRHPWSSITSLQHCAKEIGANLQPKAMVSTIDHKQSDYSLWQEIQSKFEVGDYVSWGHHWAGIFVMALRTIKLRALHVARYLAKSNHGNMHPSDVSEEIGTALYGDLMGSTCYGYPIQAMTPHEKREIAQSSKFYFEEALKLSTNINYMCESKTISWEVQFMVGKCCEKIAGTLNEEAYPSNSEHTMEFTRCYEHFMSAAIQNYSTAFAAAKKIEQPSVGLDKHQVGGSSHGSLEVLYRLHACRFKTLLSSIRRVNVESDLAILEGIRITSLHWFRDSNYLLSSSSLNDKVWDIFVDCVQALAHCRSVTYFHRAAYRLAQAFNWAIFFHDRDHDTFLENVETIPLVKRSRIPCIAAGSLIEASAEVIDGLFDKRRVQLCAVWVTTSSAPPPFEVLNDSVRKYDSLRLKYIKAFIDCMSVCGRKDRIETLLSWTMFSSQDLPGFYQASAQCRGGDPEMILKDLMNLNQHGVDEKGKQLLLHDFRLAIFLFLLLNSPCKQVVQHIRSNGPIIQAVALNKCYTSIQAGYRVNDSADIKSINDESLCLLLEQALKKGREIFPAKSKCNTLLQKKSSIIA